MMDVRKNISAKEARANFSEVIGSVYYTKQPVTVEKNGKAVVVLINPEEFVRYREYLEKQAWDVIERIRERNKDVDPDEVMRDVTEAVEEVRRENYAKRQQQQTASGD